MKVLFPGQCIVFYQRLRGCGPELKSVCFSLLIAAFCCMLSACEKKHGIEAAKYYIITKASTICKSATSEPLLLSFATRSDSQAPKFADAHYQLSLAYMKKHNGIQAMKEMFRATSLNPDNDEANLKMAGMLLLARQYDDSEKYVMRVLKKKVDNPEALTIKATIALMKKQLDEAEYLINKVIREKPDAAHLYQIRAGVYLAKKEEKKAVEGNSCILLS